MDFDAAVAYLYKLGHETLSMKLGLENVTKLAQAVGNPHLQSRAIHIAGTNGKGSTSAMVASVLEATGLRVGLYTSPHLVDIRERIRVNDELISASTFARLTTRVREASEDLVSSGDLGAPPTFFEQVTMIAFLFFSEEQVSASVLEVGLGGRLDATNICRPVVTAITPIGLDHAEHLGQTIPEIAGEKAGIIKPGVPVICAPQSARALEVISARCVELHSPMTVITKASVKTALRAGGFCDTRVETDSGVYEIGLGMRGAHQGINAATAIHVSEKLTAAGFSIGREAIISGLEETKWPGRLEVVKTNAGHRLLLDGAHNQDGIRTLCEYLEDATVGMQKTLIFGAMSDKALGPMTSGLFPFFETVIATRIKNPRSVDPGEIARSVAGARRWVWNTESSEEALALAQRVTPKGGLIVAAGSLYLIGELKSLIGE